MVQFARAIITRPRILLLDSFFINFISFIVEDSLSGVNTYKAFVDGDWILLDYDAKNKTLTHYFDGKIKPGQHELEIIVTDMVKNEKRLKLKFVR